MINLVCRYLKMNMKKTINTIVSKSKPLTGKPPPIKKRTSLDPAIHFYNAYDDDKSNRGDDA